MTIIECIALFFNLVFCIPSIASLLKFDHWWIRGFDFPRVQISILICASLVLGLVVYDFDSNWHYLVLICLFLALVYQLVQIYPYTPMAPKQVKRFHGEENDNSISILVSNVLTDNKQYHRLISLARFRNPDILLTLESDNGWEDALSVLEKDYTYCVKVPKDNLYGMHLYSKLELQDMKVRYLINDEIPSIHGNVVLANGKLASMHCLHPRPPSPSEDRTSTDRDAEILLVAREIEDDAERVLVFGDLNDVGWSRTTRLFQKISGLLDPRRGRGFFNTFNVAHPLFRWPLDHVFHSDDFSLIEISREADIGSDHFPMYTKLNYSPRTSEDQERLKANDKDRREADEKIEEATTSN